jgi:hypothetical protein
LGCLGRAAKKPGGPRCLATVASRECAFFVGTDSPEGMGAGGPLGRGGGPVELASQVGWLGCEIEEGGGLPWRFEPKWLRN